MYIVRIYGDDPQAGPGALLEEHEFVSEAAARECARNLVRDGAGTVTFNRPQEAELYVAGYAVKASEHDWTWTYSGITAAEAQEIAEALSAKGEFWTIEPIAA